MTLNSKIDEMRHLVESVPYQGEIADTFEIDRALGKVEMAVREARGIIDDIWRQKRGTAPHRIAPQRDLDFISHLDLEDLGL